VSLVKSQAIKSFSIPVFSEHLQTIRYQRLKLMATTRRLAREERLSEEHRLEICQLAREGRTVPEIVEELAKTKGLLISFEAGQRWRNKALGLSQRDKACGTFDTRIV
jgi:hypothetical protein